METVIEVEDLRKTYGSTVAVDDISFRVAKSEIFGIVGPNGAGKTTTVESLVGLRRPDAGRVTVLGLDRWILGYWFSQRQRRELCQRIGVQLQHAALQERIKVWEALDLYSSLFRRTVDWRPLVDQWGLAEKRDTEFAKLSGGQKQRLFIALALVNDPELVILDELTTGLDPQARRHSWDLVRSIRDRGTTVVLVTHFMEEAERLCDRVAIIDQGRVVALDAPDALIRHFHSEVRVRFSANNGFDPAPLLAVPGVSRIERQGQEMLVYGTGALLARVAAALAERDLSPDDIRAERASLEDVFMALTGRQIRE